MGGNTTKAEVASAVLSSTMWYHYSWQLSTVTPQVAFTWMSKINCLDIFQSYLLIQTILVAEHNWNTDELWYGSGEWGEVSQAVISHTFKWL